MTITDIATIIISIYLFARGASRGLMNSILMPFSIIVTTILSTVYYQRTNDMMISAAIGLIGPFVLFLVLKLLLNVLIKTLNNDIKQPGFFSRLAGAALTLAWGWVFIVFTLILLATLPLWGDKLKTAHDDVLRSVSYRSIAKPLQESFFPSLKQDTTPAANAPAKNAMESLADDPRFVKVLQDPEVQKDIDVHDIAKLMSNPKMMKLVQQIMSDPDALKKVMAIYRTQPQAQTVKNP